MSGKGTAGAKGLAVDSSEPEDAIQALRSGAATAPAPEPSPFHALQARISSFSELPAGWEDDARAIAPETINAAAAFVAQCFGGPLPAAYPMLEGGVSLEWRVGGRFVWLRFLHDGIAGWCTGWRAENGRGVEPATALSNAEAMEFVRWLADQPTVKQSSTARVAGSDEGNPDLASPPIKQATPLGRYTTEPKGGYGTYLGIPLDASREHLPPGSPPFQVNRITTFGSPSPDWFDPEAVTRMANFARANCPPELEAALLRAIKERNIEDAEQAAEDIICAIPDDEHGPEADQEDENLKAAEARWGGELRRRVKAMGALMANAPELPPTPPTTDEAQECGPSIDIGPEAEDWSAAFAVDVAVDPSILASVAASTAWAAQEPSSQSSTVSFASPPRAETQWSRIPSGPNGAPTASDPTWYSLADLGERLLARAAYGVLQGAWTVMGLISLIRNLRKWKG